MSHTYLLAPMPANISSTGRHVMLWHCQSVALQTECCAMLLVFEPVLQREVNYLRYLMLMEEDKRPPFSGSANACSLSDPDYCSYPPITPVQAQTNSKTRVQAECSVTDGVRSFDLTTEARQFG
jgi:hypothetical protein